MNSTSKFIGRLKGDKVKPSGDMVYNMFDGKRLDELEIDVVLSSMKECDELIDFLKVHRLCFWKPENKEQ